MTYTDGEDKISSSVIRQQLKETLKIDQAAQFLGYIIWMNGGRYLFGKEKLGVPPQLTEDGLAATN